MAVTFDWYSLRQSQKAVEQGVEQGGNCPFPPPPPPPQHLPSTRVPLLFVSERICTSKYPLAVVACSSKQKQSLEFYLNFISSFDAIITILLIIIALVSHSFHHVTLNI